MNTASGQFLEQTLQFYFTENMQKVMEYTVDSR